MRLEDIPCIADFAPNRTVLEGRKTKISEIVNLPLVFTGWTFTESKFQDNKRKKAKKEDEEEQVEVIDFEDTKEDKNKKDEKKDEPDIPKQKRECLTLQFEKDGELRVLFTSSSVLIQQLKDFIEAKPDATKFRACIQHIDNRFYKFST